MDTEQMVIALKRHHSKTWRDKSDAYWLMGLCEEVVELVGALVGLHRGPVWWELAQISAIAMNWMEKRHSSEPIVAADAANAPENDAPPSLSGNYVRRTDDPSPRRRCGQVHVTRRCTATRSPAPKRRDWRGLALLLAGLIVTAKMGGGK